MLVTLSVCYWLLAFSCLVVALLHMGLEHYSADVTVIRPLCILNCCFQTAAAVWCFLGNSCSVRAVWCSAFGFYDQVFKSESVVDTWALCC